jgi:hypothetical protein
MDNIRDACRLTTPEMLKNCRKEREIRIKHCIANDGEQFEHLI